jgi:hypothetical protein
VGPPGIDLGSLRCDATWCHGVEAAGHILRGWEEEAGRPASEVPYWDAVAALVSPPDMGWFPLSMADQGRPDLTREVMLERRDAFLDAALSRLAAARKLFRHAHLSLSRSQLAERPDSRAALIETRFAMGDLPETGHPANMPEVPRIRHLG